MLYVKCYMLNVICCMLNVNEELDKTTREIITNYF